MDRVRRMYAPFDGMRADHSRAEHPRAEHPRVPHTDPPDQTRQKRSEPKPQNAIPEPPDVPQSDSAAKTSSLLDVFMQDKDQSLILLLLVLLMKDGADMNLMLALMYLLI